VPQILNGNRSGISRLVLTVVVLASLSAAGCRDTGPRLYSVSGKVTFDGNPIETGEITFAPVGGAGRPDSGLITNGSFELKVTQGSKIIKISAVSNDPKLVGPPPPDMPPGGFNPPREYIPERYNFQSTLAAEVEAKHDQVFDFHLEK
jgi:hypothetical protein